MKIQANVVLAVLSSVSANLESAIADYAAAAPWGHMYRVDTLLEAYTVHVGSEFDAERFEDMVQMFLEEAKEARKSHYYGGSYEDVLAWEQEALRAEQEAEGQELADAIDFPYGF